MKKNWEKAWQPMIDSIGTDFSESGNRPGADKVEAGSVRKFLEPLEFDSPLHYDKETAIKHGYSDIIAPYSSLYSWTLPELWSPGTKLFDDSARNSQPTYNPLSTIKTDLAPETTGFFATDLEIDFIKPIVVGERLTRIGDKLISCVPKETKVGYGAFMTWESVIYNQMEEKISVIRMTTYSYNPHV